MIHAGTGALFHYLHPINKSSGVAVNRVPPISSVLVLPSLCNPQCSLCLCG